MIVSESFQTTDYIVWLDYLHGVTVILMGIQDQGLENIVDFKNK